MMNNRQPKRNTLIYFLLKLYIRVTQQQQNQIYTIPNLI
jgi:hypothetical protein